MKSILTATLLLGLASVSFANTQTDQNQYFQIKKVVVTDVTDQYPVNSESQPGMDENCNTANPADVVDDVNVIVDKIINLGKKLWSLVELGRPVYNVKTYTANALPQGIKCWSDLSGWNAPQSKVFKISYVNGFDSEVVKYVFRVTSTSGGNYKGVGKYITNATIMTAELEVGWGYTFNAAVEVPSVFNTGTDKSPVAGMQMNVKWSVDTVLNHIEQAETFYISGENKIEHLPVQ